MQNYITTRDGCIGFGADRDSAERDLYYNLCKKDIGYDEIGEFQKRRKELHPWNPQKNMLHLTGVGCLVYEGYMLKETKSGREVEIAVCGPSIYYYLGYLLEDTLSYTDICIAAKREINILFKNMGRDFVMLEDMPDIKVLGESNGFVPKVEYKLSQGFVIGIADDFVGIRRDSEEMFHAVEITKYQPYINLLSYVGYRVGVVFTSKGVKYVGERLE